MSNGVVKGWGRGQTALALPLGGLLALWVLSLAAQVAQIYVNYGPSYGDYQAQQNTFSLATYFFLAGIIAQGLAAVTSRRMAQDLDKTRLERAIRGFSLVAVFFSLILGAIFGIILFTSNFMTSTMFSGTGVSHAPNELLRVFNVYLPILLDAAAMVFVILRAFVSKPADAETQEEVQANG
jgi:TctA family transporter